MKKLITSVALVFATTVALAQAPQKMSYQAVIRNAGNNLIVSSPIGVRVSVLQGSASGTPVYVETHTSSTNANGLTSLQIGSGTIVSGTFASINWASGPYFIKTETDPTGGTTYSIIGTSELLSVPYALFSANGTPGATGATGAAGTNGTNGTNGTVGATGPIGATGAAGTNGTNGAVGATGAIGLTGATGAVGTNGTNGATGAVGATGAAGTNGTNGSNGVTGATGSAGTNGAIGATGVAGANGTNGAIGATGATGVNGLTGPTGPGTLSGTTNYVIKFTSSTGGGNSTIQDNGTSISMGLTTPSIIYQAYIYRQQLTVNGDGQSSLFGYRTRDSQNDGVSYAQIGTNRGSSGYSFWGDVYTFGDASYNYNDYSRCGGSLGSDVNGLYWGSNGYRSSGLVNIGVYGSGGYTSGAGLAPTNVQGGVGGGFFGMIGAMTRGSVIGQLNAGDLFASYNMGDVYTSGKNVELVTVNNQVSAAYAVTSTEAVIYKKGNIRLVNGTATVSFDSEYAQLLGEKPVVTISPMGQCNGVYIESVSKEGFVVRELNNGTSNVELGWIAVGDRVDAKTTEVPAFIKTTEFNKGLDRVLFNDGNKNASGEGLWWDGTKLQMNKNYPNSINLTREQKTALLLGK
jgi:Collagen triple helix repeat (20 copies)